MAKLSSIAKNKRREKMSLRDQVKRQKLKDVVMNRSLILSDRFKASIQLAKLPRNGAKNRLRLRCELTGRSRSNYRKFRLCRIAFRELANSGQLPGVVKSSW